MSSRTPNITSLTHEYDAIERALRETTRGRWFLNCYLERNRSAETRMLLEAIARLEGAMRENGHVVESFDPVHVIAVLAEAIGEARADIAGMTGAQDSVAPLPVPRFAFTSIPGSAEAAAQTIREAAVSIANAASALRNAGVFQAVSRQITERAEEILRACETQDRAIRQTQRMAALVSEIEAEIMAAMDSHALEEHDMHTAEPRMLHEHDALMIGRTIPGGVMHELTLALSDSDLPDEEIITPL